MARVGGSVNVTRMSIAVHTNLENDEGGNYAAATAGEGRSEVQLHNADAELDFEERQPEEGVRKLCGSCAPSYYRARFDPRTKEDDHMGRSSL